MCVDVMVLVIVCMLVSVRYGCDQCEYKATQQGNLKQHKESKHEGVKI